MNPAYSLQTAHNQPALDKPTSQAVQTQLTISDPDGANYDQRFNKQIEQWIMTLAEEQEFKSWKGAQWESFPLGPGTHGWSILIYQDEKEVGYLIVHSSPEGDLQLTEYGVGEFPLFSLTTLYRTMTQHELIPTADQYEAYIKAGKYHVERVYLNSFQAVWKLYNEDHIYYFDAITGEAFPLREKLIQQIHENTEQRYQERDHLVLHSNLASSLKNRLILPVFDPFDQLNWISSKPLSIETPPDLIQALKADLPQITYTALIFNDIILVPLALVGYHQWEHQVSYISVDQQGLRFVPTPTVLHQGEFFLRN